MDTCTGSHNWRNAAANDETTDIILYAKNVLSIQTIMDKVKELLTQKYGKSEGDGFIVPSIFWVYLNLSTLHENQKTAEIYTVNPPFKRMLLLRTEIDNAYPHSHWVAGLDKYCKYHTSCLFRIIASDL